MDKTKSILSAVKNGEMSVDEALVRLKSGVYDDIDLIDANKQAALKDNHVEVIYGEGKTVEHIAAVLDGLKERGIEGALVTRLSKEKFEKLADNRPIEYFPKARLAVWGKKRPADGLGKIAVVTAGTSDIPIAEEAAVTAEFLGNEVERIYDVGVSELDKLLANKERILEASVVITIAGMEGAIACVVAGFIDSPIIAVPTSVGYGASFEGLTALLSMLNACSCGITVVNIDNGFGAGFAASRINHMKKK